MRGLGHAHVICRRSLCGSTLHTLQLSRTKYTAAGQLKPQSCLRSTPLRTRHVHTWYHAELGVLVRSFVGTLHSDGCTISVSTSLLVTARTLSAAATPTDPELSLTATTIRPAR